jgi:hypothetical protein
MSIYVVETRMLASPAGGLLWAVPILLLSLVGSLMIARPYSVAKFNEQMDAIGSTRNHRDVEPADWAVTAYRICGVLVLFAALAVVLDVTGVVG